jgi:hypothetical protein
MHNVPTPFMSNALTIWSLGHNSVPPPETDAMKQKSWDMPIIKATIAKLLNDAVPQDKGRLLAVQRKETGAWLTAPPASSLLVYTFLRNQESIHAMLH